MAEPKGPNQFPQNQIVPTETVEKKLEIQLRQHLMKELSVKYNIDPKDLYFNYYTLEDLLRKPIEAFGGLANLKDKRILDLGCGSVHSYDRERNYKSRGFEPWLCRALQELGAHPVGVDVNYALEEEEFEHYVLDLLKPGALDIFPDQSFDGINSVALFDSPMLNAFIDSKEEIEAMKKEIGAQIKRLLKTDGKLLTIKRYGDDNLKAELGLV